MMQLSVYLLLAFVILAITTFGGAESDTIEECLKETDPMGATYRGIISQTENGLECQRWDTDEPHRRHQKPDDPDNNYCRNPNPDEEVSSSPWCYTNVPGDPRWEYCSIKTCGPCTGMRYDNKCFVYFPGLGDYDSSAAKCKSRGGKLANLYGVEHMNDIMKYIREDVLRRIEWRGRLVHVRTGMIFNPMTEKLTLRDGTDAPDGLKWYADYPSTGKIFADYTNVALVVRPDTSYTRQYLRNYNRHSPYQANVLCEFE